MKHFKLYGILVSIFVVGIFSCKKNLVEETEFEQNPKISSIPPGNTLPSGLTNVSSTSLFEDDFNGTSYDTTKWFPRTGKRFNNQSVNLEANITQANGLLAINFKDDQGQPDVYSCGGLISRKAMGYGYYEARVALFTGSAGLHQSFWSFNASGFPETSVMFYNDLIPRNNSVIELDGFETDSRDGVAEYNNHTYIPSNTHPGGGNLGTYSTWFLAGYEWLPDRVNFYINGVYKNTRMFTGIYNVYAQQNLWLTALFIPTSPGGSNGWYDFGGHSPLTNPNAKMQVDYVRYFPSTATGINLIGNPSFEYNKGNSNLSLQDPVAWIETRSISGYNTDASKVEDVTVAQSAHTGEYRLRHESTSDYLTTTKQIINYIPNGNYKLTAWVKSSVHLTPSRMRALAFGGTDLDINIPQTNNWQLITIDNIYVSNNQAVVAFTSNAKAGEWIVVDDVKFEKK